VRDDAGKKIYEQQKLTAVFVAGGGSFELEKPEEGVWEP